MVLRPSYIAPKISSLAPETIKSCDSLKSFKQKIRKWKSDCPYSSQAR